MKDIRAANHGGTQSSVTRIVIHGTVSPCKRGGALNVAQFFARPSTKASAHYVVDPGEIVRCLPEDVVGWHAPPNTGSIGIELCDPQKGPDGRWSDDDHEAMLRLAAELVRQVAARWKVPLVRLSVAELKAGSHGICGHADVANAFHRTDHSDPGKTFPWAHFMDLVRGADETDGVSVWPGQLLQYPPVMRGDNVRRWQAQMVKLGYALAVDGAYGERSRTVCRAFQRKAGLDDDGIVGRKTWNAAFKQEASRKDPQ